MTADHVRVLHETGSAATRTVWTSPTAFTRVDLDRSGRNGAEVRLLISGRRLVVGRVLGPQAREDLAGALDRAIREARAERHAT